MVHFVARALRRAMPVLLGIVVSYATQGFCVEASAQAQAQAGTVSGSIVDSKTGLPLADVIIHALGTELRTRSNIRGEFRLTGLTGSTIQLNVRRIGIGRAPC